MAYDAKAVANCFLSLAQANGQLLTPMKLQKLVYFAHGWSLGLTGQPLIDEPVQAWPYGPVVPSLYHEFKHFGARPIGSAAVEFDFEKGDFFAPHIPETDEDATRIIERIWEVYGKHSAMDLSNHTHLPGTPWDDARKTLPDQRSAVISDETIREYFSKLAEQNRQAKKPHAA